MLSKLNYNSQTKIKTNHTKLHKNKYLSNHINNIFNSTF